MAKIRSKRSKFSSVFVPIVTVVLLLAALEVLKYLDGSKVLKMSDMLKKVVDVSSLMLAIWLSISIFLRLTKKSLFKIFIEPEERIFYSKLYSWSLYTIGFLFILSKLGVSLGNITLFAGLLATGLAFAIRDVLLSFFGWMILLRKKPFRIGDYIRIGDDEGKVLHIGTFYVRIDRAENSGDDFTQVPNRYFMEKSIEVIGKTTIFDNIKFPLSALPENCAVLIEDLKKQIAPLTDHEMLMQIYTDVRDEKLLLVVELELELERRQTFRSKVVEAVYNKFKEVLVFDN
jgi:small-conductance mechanosensitive channel